MNINTLNNKVSVSAQITVDDVKTLADEGITLLVCNRPDGEASDQTTFDEINQAAQLSGMKAVHMPFTADPSTAQVEQFKTLLGEENKIHAYCRTGNRSTKLFNAAVSLQGKMAAEKSVEVDNSAYNGQRFDVVIIGAGSGGIAASASLLKRDGSLRIAIVDPSQHHYYQPGWTMVGGGIFSAESTQRNTAELIDSRVQLIRGSATTINADENTIVVDGAVVLHYDQLIVSPGLVLNWGAIEGLKETLGKNGVTSNYRYDLAPYTWELVQQLKSGNALFAQPPMPIKCAGAPQKALYLSADHWYRTGVLNNINIDFCNAGGVLFGVSDYVPALMEYIKKYQAKLSFNSNLVKINGDKKLAWFETTNEAGEKIIEEKPFDMIHVCPPQVAPAFIQASGLADAAGWLDVDQASLQHKRYSNIWGLGDVMNTPNAKTMAAVRKQVPVVAKNVFANRAKTNHKLESYDGYGSCPLTVERGKVVLAEFCYGGRVAPTLPTWLLDGKKPTSAAWHLKANILPTVYWKCMLNGREWLTDCPECES